MKKFIQNKLKDQKGLTLIELLAVIVILAIIAAIAIPAIGNIIENSRYNAIKSDATNIMASADMYYADGNKPTGAAVTVSELKTGGYLDDAGSFEKDAANTTVSRTVAANGTTAAAASKINGKAEVGNVKLTLNATRQDVNKISRTTVPVGTAVTVTSGS